MPADLFTASLTPDVVEAGSVHCFEIKIQPGSDFDARACRFVFDFPTTLGMSRPNLTHRETPGYVDVQIANPQVGYKLGLWNPERGEMMDFVPGNPNQAGATRFVVLDVGAGLKPGDTIILQWGVTSDGYGTATHVTTVVPRPDHQLFLDVRYFKSQEAGMPDFARDWDGYQRPEPDANVKLAMTIRPRPADHLRLIRQVHRAVVQPLDMFENVAEVADITALIDTPQAQISDQGVIELPIDAKVTAKTLPMAQTPSPVKVDGEMNLYFGDMHTHSAFSNDCYERENGTMTPALLYAHARYRSCIDFLAVTDHHQPWDQPRNHIGRERWQATCEAAARYDQPGRFAAYVGFEFRGPRGDSAVVFKEPVDYDTIVQSQWQDIRALWQGLAGRDYLTIPHFHNAGRLDDQDWWHPADTGDRAMSRIEPVLEIFSCHGSYERADPLEQAPSLIKSRRPDRNAWWFLNQGYRYGLVGNSDGHKGHVGTNGLTAVYAKDLSRDSVFDAIRAGRCYATTGKRIRLVFKADDLPMGSERPAGESVRFDVQVVGESALKKVELVHAGKCVKLLAPDSVRFEDQLTITRPQPGPWMVRATQRDNHIAFSSPIWLV